MDRTYLDYNATTPLRPEVVEAMLETLQESYGNPSSVHWHGSQARQRLAEARSHLAGLLGVAPDSLVFTSGATEASNTILNGLCRLAPDGRDEIVTCATEHPCVLDVCDALRAQGYKVRVLPVDREGRLGHDAFDAALNERTLVASVMWVNNETGVIQDIPELAARARAKGVLMHTDAVQALGKLSLDLAAAGVDYASFSAHKLGGPKGVGAFYVRPGAPQTALLIGGPQEQRRRAGTENVPGIVGFGAACRVAAADLVERSRRLAKLRDRLWEGISKEIPNCSWNGAPDHRVTHTLSVSFPGADATALVEALDLEGMSVASGAACASGSTEPSHVLMAMGVPSDAARGSIRLSLGFASTDADVDRALDLLPPVVARVRAAGAA